MSLKANLSEAKKPIKRTGMLKKNKKIGLKGKGFFPTALIGCIYISPVIDIRHTRVCKI